MRVLYAGFNLYGQIIHEPESIVRLFKEFTYPSVKSLECCYSYTVIQNDEGFFVHGGNEADTRVSQKLDFIELKDVVEFSGTDKWCLFLKSSGDILKWEIADPQKIHYVPRFLYSETDDKITRIGCNSHICVASSKNGKLFNVPNALQFECKLMKNIAVGREHCLILDEKGNVFSFGRGSRGQLGHGDLNDETEPKQIQSLAGIKVSSIAAGGWHSCALSADGDLYTWGWNSNGQLGLMTDAGEAVSVMATPHAVDFFDKENKSLVEENVLKIACGSRHTIAILADKRLYGCGWNKYNQLGILTDSENTNRMQQLLDLSPFKDVPNIKCGPWSTAIVLT